MRRTAFAAFLLVTATASSCHSLRAPEEPKGPHIKVLTYNLNFGAPTPEKAIQAMAGSGADILCLQETTPRWEALIRSRLGTSYPHMAFQHSEGAGGLACLSRWPISETAFIPPEAGWFPGWILSAETPIGRTQLLNVHLRPPLDAGEGLSSIPGAYLRTKAIRLEEIRGFVERMDAASPAILLGDFNEEDRGRALSWLRKRGFMDALAEFDTRADTWERETAYATLSARLDHILHSPHFRCLSARVLRQGASDHFPVLAVLERSP